MAAGPWPRSRSWSAHPGPGRWARPRSGPGLRRSSGSPRPGTVELGREKRARRLEDLIRPAQLTILAFQLDDPLPLGRWHAGPLATVDLGLVDPVAQGLPVDAQLLGDPSHRPGPLAGLLAQLQHHPHGALAQLRRVSPQGWHGGILS